MKKENKNKESLPPSKEEILMEELSGQSGEDLSIEDTPSGDESTEDTSSALDDSPSEENASGSKKKVPVMYGVKKLPSMFRKSYSEKSFNNRILKKIYVAEDKERIQKIFESGANPKRPELLAVRQDSVFSKKEVNFYKKLSKEINAQKGFIKFAPLTAVVVFIITLVTLVGIFKDPLVKKGLKMGLESVFGAKTDIRYVNLGIFSSRLTVKGLAVGNKNQVMKNLFEAEKIELDFNLVQLLRKKIVVQNVECSGMAFNTDRTTSCALPQKQDGAKEDDSFVADLKAKTKAAVDDIKDQAYDLLGGSDVESILATIRDQVKTPKAAKAALETSKTLVEKWKAKPDELKGKVDDFGDTIKDLRNLNVSSFNPHDAGDWKKLNDYLSKINAAIEKSKQMKAEAEALVQDVKGDVKTVQDTAVNIKKSAESDIAYAKERLTTITGAIKNADQLFINAIRSVAYSVIGDYCSKGKYYYYKAMEAKAKVDALKPKSGKKKLEKRQGRTRLKGTTFWFNTGYPSLLVERVYASGTGFSAEVKEITNDQDWRGNPTVFNGSLDLKGLSHKANAVFDTRSSSKAPLVTVGYSGSGFKADFNGSRVASKSGVPSLKGPAVISLDLTADPSGFSAGGSINLDPLTLSSDGFENELVTRYYNMALSAVNNLNVGFKTGYTKSGGIFLDLSGNFGEQFVNSLKAVVMGIGMDAKNAALKKISDEINASSNEYLAKAKEFLNIEGDIDLQNMRLSDLQGILEKKKAEVESKLKEKANKATDKAVDSLKDKVKGATGSDSASDAAGNAAAGAASKLLKGFGL
ncbi:MAG: hypothetical protein J5817_07820 [Treponema sp.]|nr:hypothetical protein [Treponema sp.]